LNKNERFWLYQKVDNYKLKGACGRIKARYFKIRNRESTSESIEEQRLSADINIVR
jgi:hypothetical protein